MTSRVVIEEEAEKELVEAVNFYDEHEPGIRQRFARELRSFFERVCRDPERFPLSTHSTGRARMPRPWPYSIYFTINRKTSEVIISTIWHAKRDPAELRRRLK